METKTMTRDLTGGSVPKLLLRFALPLFVSNALQAIYNLVDMIVVGQVIGGAGMSAVSIGGDILYLLTFVAMGFSSAGQVIIAQQVGAKQTERVRRTIGTMFTLLLTVAAGISLICYFLRHSILSWINTPAESYAYTMDYTVTCIAGLVFIYGYNIVSAILRGMGDSRRPFLFIAIAAVLNIILDILFVAYMDMKVFGAALATVIGQGASFVISLIYLYRRRAEFGFDFKPASFIVDRDSLSALVALGVPMAIQSAAIHLSKLVLTAWINAEGVVFSALSGIYNKVNTMSGVVSNSFTTAGSSMVGQNLGAGKYERVPLILRTVNMISLCMALIGSAVVFLDSGTIFKLFTEDASVLGQTAILIWPMILNFFGAATRSTAFALINGSGNTKLNFAVAVIDGMISRIGISALLGFALGMGCSGFWYGDALAGFVPIIIGMCYGFSGRWRRPAQDRYKAA